MKITLFILFILLNTILDAQTLNEFISIAEQNSYEIAINKVEYEIAKEKVNEAGGYEHTEFSVGAFISSPETYVGRQVLYLGVSQNLPWFGTKEATKSVEKAKARVKEYDIALSQKELIYQVKISYYELYQKQVLSSIYEENSQLLASYEEMAMAALESSSATMSDVLKIVVQKNELHSKKFQNINSIVYLNRIFNRLLQRPEDTPLYISDSLNVLDLLFEEKSIDNHPIIESINASKDIYESELLMVKKNKALQFNVGVDYVLINQNPAFKSSTNGNDILMPRFSVALPIFNGKQFNSLENQIILKRKVLDDEIENKKNLLGIELEKANLLLENAILMVVAAQKNQEEVQRVIDLNINTLETGLLKHEKILTLQLQKIKYQIIELDAVVQAFKAKAKVDYLTMDENN